MFEKNNVIISLQEIYVWKVRYLKINKDKEEKWENGTIKHSSVQGKCGVNPSLHIYTFLRVCE
jgi:hypothetical protein